MKTKTTSLIELWEEARTRFSLQIAAITPEDLKKHLGNSPNSAGFLIRHIAEVELLFAKNVFGDTSVKVNAKTVIDKKDTGTWTNLQELILFVSDSYTQLKAIVEKQTDEDWDSQITTKEFGSKTKSEAFGRIVSHTAYHAGQLALVLKYGT